MNTDSRVKNISREGRYALLFGGKGYEREVSISGARVFLKEAERLEVDFLPVFIDAHGDFYVFLGSSDDVLKINRKSQRSRLVQIYPIRQNGISGFLIDGELVPIKLVFPLLHGDFGEDGVIQGLLSALDFDFVGADNFTGAVAADKLYSKLIARSVGVPTLPEVVISADTDLKAALEKIDNNFGFPTFVKPARLGSSIGASIAKSKQEFAKSLKNALSVSQRVIAEPAILKKRELECAYYSVGNRKIITPPAEVSVDTGFYDFRLKYKRANDVRLIPEADVTNEVKEKIISYTDTLAEAFSVRHIARFDYFLLPDGQVYFNEVNTMPGMTETSLYSAMLSRAGLGFSDFILSFFENRFDRRF